jgi:hypothetical protein
VEIVDEQLVNGGDSRGENTGFDERVSSSAPWGGNFVKENIPTAAAKQRINSVRSFFHNGQFYSAPVSGVSGKLAGGSIDGDGTY